MTKPSNWPHWRHLQVGSSHDSGAILVEFLVALAVTGLIVTILMSTSWLQLRAYQATMEQSEAPVSYTHLDVYKRQVLVLSLALVGAVVVSRLAVPHLEELLAYSGAVSYTHLDVYKRQHSKDPT